MPVMIQNDARPAYAELQVTSNFSFLRGGSHAHELVETAKQLGLEAIAVADRNTLSGVVRAHTAAKEAGVRFVVGARLDLYDAPSLLCFPKDRSAYGRLSRLLSLGQSRAVKGECTLDLSDVARHAEGHVFVVVPPETWNWREVQRPPDKPAASAVCSQVINLSRGGACAVGENIQGKDKQNNEASAGGRQGRDEHDHHEAHSIETFEQSLYRIHSALSGRAGCSLYLAISHLYRGDDVARAEALAQIASRVGIELVATNDVLYHDPNRRPLQDVLTCVREKTTIHKAGMKLEANAERHLKSPGEMARSVPRPRAIVEKYVGDCPCLPFFAQ